MMMPDRNRLWRSSIPLVLAGHALVLVPFGGAQGRTLNGGDADSVGAWSSDLLRAAEDRAQTGERAVHVLDRLKRGDRVAVNADLWPAPYLAVLREVASQAVPSPPEDITSRPDPQQILTGFRFSNLARDRLQSFIRDYLRSHGLPEQTVAVPLVESAFDPLRCPQRVHSDCGS